MNQTEKNPVSVYTNDTEAEIIALEKQALAQWNNGNPDGFIALSTEDVIYMDPALETKIQGKKALEAYYNPLRGKVNIKVYHMKNPTVQVSSDTAVLTYDYEALREGQWFKMHCTEVYEKIAAVPTSASVWKINHTHWSFVWSAQ